MRRLIGVIAGTVLSRLTLAAIRLGVITIIGTVLGVVTTLGVLGTTTMAGVITAVHLSGIQIQTLGVHLVAILNHLALALIHRHGALIPALTHLVR